MGEKIFTSHAYDYCLGYTKNSKTKHQKNQDLLYEKKNYFQ